MGIFRRPSTTAANATAAAPPAPAAPASVADNRGWGDGSAFILRPHLTEKTARLSELGQYTFVVRAGAGKVAIAHAIAERYGVHPTHVTTVRLPGKVVRSGKITGRRSPLTKATVTLRAGEKIPFGVKS